MHCSSLWIKLNEVEDTCRDDLLLMVCLSFTSLCITVNYCKNVHATVFCYLSVFLYAIYYIDEPVETSLIGIVYPKTKIVSFYHPHVISNMYGFLLQNTSEDILNNVCIRKPLVFVVMYFLFIQ